MRSTTVIGDSNLERLNEIVSGLRRYGAQEVGFRVEGTRDTTGDRAIYIIELAFPTRECNSGSGYLQNGTS